MTGRIGRVPDGASLRRLSERAGDALGGTPVRLAATRTPLPGSGGSPGPPAP